MTEKLEVTNNERIVYSINVEDLQNVANDELSRELTPDEIEMVEDRLGDYIAWYASIVSAIKDVINDRDKING